MSLILTPLLLGVLNFAGVSCLKLDVSSKHVHAKLNETINIMCKSDTPLVGCQFTWKNRWSVAGPLIDFKLGPSTAPVNSEFASNISYSGQGLQHGDCGITLVVPRWASRIVGCRVRAANEDWEYEYAFVVADSRTEFPMTINANEIVAKVGDNVRIICTANQPLNDCTFGFPTNQLARFNKGHRSREHKDTASQYEGTGLENGQCGVLIRNVTSALNGWIICSAKTDADNTSLEVLGVALIVAQPPNSVNMQVEENPVPIGRALRASCEVPASRPPPNITWYFGSDVLRKNAKSDASEADAWLWVDTPHPILQRIQHNVTADDNGKDLRCSIDHVALPNTLVSAQRITVKAPASCRPLSSKSVYILCVWAGNIISCNERVPPTTMARLQCKLGYVVPHPHPGFTNVTCMENGKWSREIYECIIDCGRRNTNAGDTLIHGGYQAKIGEFPWHVAVYEETGPDTYKHICGGSLITEDEIISAAHCFWDNQLGVKKDKSLYTIAAGKYYRELTREEDRPPQIRKFLEIKLPERYKGRDSNFAQDIAHIKLSEPVEINSRVSTICIDWENSRERFDLADGINGTVAGWGFTETGEQSNELDAVDLPFVPFRICYDALPQLAKPILTDDKYCAGYLNKNVSVCGGDSGGGLVYYNPVTDRYTIRGIVSLAFKPVDSQEICYAQLYTAFTKVSRYREWLQRPFQQN